jgi:hypothetical protein
MQNLTNLYSEDYGQRIIVKRTYLESVDVEALMLLSEMLSIAPVAYKKKDISTLASGRVDFHVENYGDGLLFVGRLIQAQNKKLHYLFADPYQDGLALFENLYVEGFVENEELLAQAKDHLVSKADTFEAKNAFRFKAPAFDHSRVTSLTMKDLKACLELVSKSQSGDYLFFGPMPIKDPFLKVTGYQKPLPEISVGYKAMEEDDNILIGFKGKKIASMEDYLLRKASLLAIDLSLENYYQKNFAADLKPTFYFVDAENAFLSLEVVKGDTAFLKSKLPSLQGLDASHFLEESMLDTRLDAVRKMKSSEVALAEFELLSDFKVKDLEKDFFQDIVLDEKKAEQDLESLTMLTKGE